MNKLKLLTLLSSLLIISTPPSIASTQDGSLGGNIQDELPGFNIFSQGLGLLGIDLDSYLGSVQDFVLNEITKSLNLDRLGEDLFSSVLNKQILEGLGDKLGDLFGVLGFPDTQRIGQEIPEVIINTKSEEVAEFTTFDKKRLAISSSKRMLTKAYLQSRLGESAQAVKKQQLTAISNLAEHSVDSATTAASQTITQNVLRQLASQNAGAALISQSTHAEIVQLNLNQTMTVNELSEISTHLEQQNWKNSTAATAKRISLVEETMRFGSLF